MKKISVFLIRLVSLFFRSLGLRACRFHPTCSDYAAQAFEHRGWTSAVFLSIGRLLRCHPFSSGGYDPIDPRQIKGI